VKFASPANQDLVDQESVNEGVIVKTNDMSSNLDFVDLYHSLYTLCVFHVNEEISIQLGFALKGGIVMTVFSANKAVKHLHSLVSSVEALHAPLEVAALLPKDGIPGIDYFSIHNPEHLILLRLRVFANLPRGELRDAIFELQDEDFTGHFRYLPLIGEFTATETAGPSRVIVYPFNIWMLREIPNIRIGGVLLGAAGMQTWVYGMLEERKVAYNHALAATLLAPLPTQ
jgi:hypothetical protein